MTVATLIVEDDPAACEHFVEVVASMSELELVGAARRCDEARASMDEHRIDLLLTDLGLPDGSGIELIGELRARSPNAEIVVITVFGDERNVIRSIEAGASGYLLKGSEAGALRDSLRELLAGGSPMSPAIARHVLRRFRAPAPEPRTPTSQPRPESPLSTREQQVLDYLAKGFTFREVGELLGVTEHTVTTHMRRVYRKLEVSSKSEAIYEAASRGLLSFDAD